MKPVYSQPEPTYFVGFMGHVKHCHPKVRCPGYPRLGWYPLRHPLLCDVRGTHRGGNPFTVWSSSVAQGGWRRGFQAAIVTATTQKIIICFVSFFSVITTNSLSLSLSLQFKCFNLEHGSWFFLNYFWIVKRTPKLHQVLPKRRPPWMCIQFPTILLLTNQGV